MNRILPTKPSLVFLKKQAKDLLEELRAGDPGAAASFANYFPNIDRIGLTKAQFVLAREYGFESWLALKSHMEILTPPTVEAFIDAALKGELSQAKAWWKDHSEFLRQDLVAAAIAGDLESVSTQIAGDRNLLQAGLPPKQRPLLCYVCFSQLALDPNFEASILEVASMLLKAGANPDAAYEIEWGTEKWRETALYGAAGVLNHAGLTKLLLDSGADPDDGAIQDGVYHGESLYHACDHPGKNECVRLILEANPSQIAADYCFKRKLDFEDVEGIRLFLEHGANPNANRPRTALSHAILRGRSLEVLQMLLDAGADPNQPDEDETTPYVLARRLANKEASALLEARGANKDFTPHDSILIAAAEGDTAEVQRLADAFPEVLTAFSDAGRQENDGLALGSSGQILHDMARLGHVSALRALLDLGMSPALVTPYNETPLHWACVAGRPEAAKLLLERGAPLDVVETNHKCTPIMWAYWGSLYWNEPHGDYAKTVEVVLDAGEKLPTKLEGSPAVLAVLKARGAG